MRLNDTQIARFNQQGYLFFPSLLEDDEVEVLQRAMPEILSRQGPEVIPEKDDSGAVRLVFGAHVYSEPFRYLSLLPRLLNPVRQLLQEDVYLHQSRLNPKQGFGGGAAWDWHQDYPPWHRIDGMAEPKCIMASVFIDDCTAVTSPLLVVPGSHTYGLLDSKPHQDAKGYALHHIDRATLEQLTEESGIRSVDRVRRICLFLPLQCRTRFSQQCLPLAAVDHVLELQRGKQCLYRHRA